jgi:hypothetical protein
VKRAIVCLVGLLSLSSLALAQATTLRFESTPRLALPLPRVRDPRVVLRAARELVVVAVQELDDRARLVALHSQDGGDSFSDPVAISLPGTWMFGTGESGPALTQGSRGLCVAWHQARNGGGADLMVSASETGAQWSKPTRLVDRPGVSHGYVALSAAPDGTVYAAWLDSREKPSGSVDVYLARSTDGGRSFGKNVRVARRASPACRPAVAITADGAVHVAWRGVDESNVRDVYLASSRDLGQTFGEPLCPVRDGWKVSDSPRSGPTLVAVGETLHLAWYSEGRGGREVGIRWTTSLSATPSFAPMILVSRGARDTDHPVLSVSSVGRVYLTFRGRPEVTGGWQSFRTYVSEVTSWVAATRGAQTVPGTYEEVSYPVGQCDATGRLWVFWTAGEAVLLSRAREIGP